MRLIFITGREIGYQRNDVIFRALNRITELEVLSEWEYPPSLLVNSIKYTLQSIPKILFEEYDLIFVGFYGHLLMLPVGLLSKRPVLFDAFISTYDTLIEDRGIWKPGSIIAQIARLLDRFACNLADHILLDTDAHIEYFVKNFRVAREKFSACPVGCNEEIFYPRKKRETHNKTSVIYYTSYLPLHGVDVVVKAASLLSQEPVHFRLIGGGQTYSQVRELACNLGLQNIEFLAEMPISQIADEIAEADICLGGHFGISAKASRVIPGKVYQILAMERPLIATTTPANLELLKHGESAYLCQAGNPNSLAEAILDFHRNPDLRETLAVGGRHRYLERCSESVITELLRNVVSELLNRAV